MTCTTKSTTAAALLAAGLFAVPAEPATATSLELTKPMAGATMFFADRYATAYYTVDKSNFRTVVTIAPGPGGNGNPVQLVNALADGETAEYSVGGYGDNAIKVTLKLVRQGDTVTADVKTLYPLPNS